MTVDVSELWAEHSQRPSPETLEALVVHYEPLARYLARRALAKAPPWQDREDILSFAHHGLLDAIRLFDVNAGVKFETYATRRIAGAIIDQQRRMDPLTRNQRKSVKQLEAAILQLEEELCREPNERELAGRLQWPVEDVRTAFYDRQSLQGSLDEVMHGDEDSSTKEEALFSDSGGRGGTLTSYATSSDAEIGIQLAEARQRLSSCLARLAPWQRGLLLAHYHDEKTLQEIADGLGVTKQRCVQLKGDVLRRLSVSG